MTRTEAIEQLETLKEHCASQKAHKHHEPWESDMEALDMAIEALEEDEKNAKYGSELARIVAEHDRIVAEYEEVSNGH